MLKCSTSSFSDCLFSPSGQYLFTVFKDSTFFVWLLEDYSNTQYSIDGKKLKVASNYSSYVCLYNQQQIFIGDLSTQLIFQEIDVFWDSKLVKVDFIENVLIIQTESAFYLV